MIVFMYRQGKSRLNARSSGIAVGAFHNVPSVVLAVNAGRRLDIHLLIGPLPHVRDKKVSRSAVKRETPGIPETVCPYFFAKCGIIDKRVCRRHGVGNNARFNVNTENLAKKHRGVLGIAVWIASAPTVADPGIQVTIGPERKLAAIVIGEHRMRDDKKYFFCFGVCSVGIDRRKPVPGDRYVAVQIRVINIKMAFAAYPEGRQRSRGLVRRCTLPLCLYRERALIEQPCFSKSECGRIARSQRGDLNRPLRW
jgi:hypothetical protein